MKGRKKMFKHGSSFEYIYIIGDLIGSCQTTKKDMVKVIRWYEDKVASKEVIKHDLETT